MFISKVYRPYASKWPWYACLALEFPMSVGLLTLFGIADPDTYRKKLWEDGAKNGFNSSPKAQIYAAANYQPYKIPGVWSQFITNWNFVIAILVLFVMLAKVVMFILHLFPPLLSLFTHSALLALYAVSVAYQAGSDMSDPAHPQPGPPWYITKSCSVAVDKNNVHYCKQAKAAFACSIIVLVVYAFHVLHALFSLWPSKETRATHSEKTSRARSAYAEAAALTPAPSTAHRSLFPASIRSPMFSPSDPENTEMKGSWGREALERGTFGGLQPMTPRTHAFNRLGGTKDLPLRNHFSSPNAPRSPTFGVKSPLATTFESAHEMERGETPPPSEVPEGSIGERGRGPMYFPPPPKVSGKGTK